MKIRVVATGSSKWERYVRHWGVSFLLGEEVLFDTFGDSDFLARSMRRMKIDTSRIRHIVLSHDDWDHISGLWQLITAPRDITVHICPGFKQEIKDKIAAGGVRLVEAEGPTRITENIYSAGELYGHSDGRDIYEQSVVVKTTNGLVVLCGCAHPGVANIVTHVTKHFPGGIELLIGGFHLKDKAAVEIQDMLLQVKAVPVRNIAPMHCTGALATQLMRRAFGRNFICAREGDIITV